MSNHPTEVSGTYENPTFTLESNVQLSNDVKHTTNSNSPSHSALSIPSSGFVSIAPKASEPITIHTAEPEPILKRMEPESAPAEDNDADDSNEDEKCHPIDRIVNLFRAALKWFRQFLIDLWHWMWDGKKKRVCGLSWRSWLWALLLYLVIYSSAAGVFVATLAIYYAQLDPTVPTQTGYNSILQLYPGALFHPRPSNTDTLLSFNMSDPASWGPMVWDIGNFTSKYATVNAMNLPLNSSSLANYARLVDCSKMTRKSVNDLHTSCNVNLNAANLYPCVASENYGYPQGSPCVLLAVNKVFGWVPVPSSKVGADNEENYVSDVRLKCFGQTPADTENMNRTFYGADPANNPNFAGWAWVNGALVNATNMTVSSNGKNVTQQFMQSELVYLPSNTIGRAAFPYLNQPNYLQPFIFVKFLNPPRNVELLVNCVFYLDTNSNAVSQSLSETLLSSPGFASSSGDWFANAAFELLITQ